MIPATLLSKNGSIFLSLLSMVLLAPSMGQAQESLGNAVVRIPSHGCSGTVIRTGPEWSQILTCAHAFEGKARERPIRIDGATQPRARKAFGSRIRLLAIDEQLDLALLEIDNGPFTCCPVAPPDHRPGKLLSVGYDGMRWPGTSVNVTMLETDKKLTFTRERPGHGRSGGGLLDVTNQFLVGTVVGYEIGGEGRGLYTSHRAILDFLRQVDARAPLRSTVPPCPP